MSVVLVLKSDQIGVLNTWKTYMIHVYYRANICCTYLQDYNAGSEVSSQSVSASRAVTFGMMAALIYLFYLRFFFFGGGQVISLLLRKTIGFFLQLIIINITKHYILDYPQVHYHHMTAHTTLFILQGTGFFATLLYDNCLTSVNLYPHFPLFTAITSTNHQQFLIVYKKSLLEVTCRLTTCQDLAILHGSFNRKWFVYIKN